MKHPLALATVGFIALLGIALYVEPDQATTTPSPKLTASTRAPTADETAALNAKLEADRVAHLWDRSETIDVMTGKPVVTVSTTSSNSFILDFPHRGIHHAYIQVRKHPRYGTDVLITVDDGQLNCAYRDCRITARFDDLKPTSFFVTEPADHSHNAWFIDDAGRFIQALAKSKKVAVELQFYRQGTHALQFETIGFKRP